MTLEFNYYQKNYIEVKREALELSSYKISKRALEKEIEKMRLVLGPLPSNGYVYFQNHECFINGYNRIVLGGHGPYIEFSPSYLFIGINLLPNREQSWRLDPKYKVKYLWLYPTGHPEIKVYQQVAPVKYADYKVGMFYVDLFSVLVEEQ